jgi:tetratricopeptide (TPR) repeat protein
MKFLLISILMVLSLQCFAQSEKDLVAQANKYELLPNESAAYETFKKVIRINPGNYYAQWKLSELASRIGNRKATSAEKQQYFNDGKNFAAEAIKINPNGADGYYAMAVAMGRLALTQSGKDKVNSAKEIKTLLEKALKLNPTHSRAWHVLGKWHYEVSNLSMLEKTLLKIIYGGVPAASLANAIRCYEKSKTLDPNFALNYLELAKAYKRNDEKNKAIELLKKLPSIPNKSEDDPTIKAKGAALLKELSE